MNTRKLAKLVDRLPALYQGETFVRTLPKDFSDSGGDFTVDGVVCDVIRGVVVLCETLFDVLDAFEFPRGKPCKNLTIHHEWNRLVCAPIPVYSLEHRLCRYNASGTIIICPNHHVVTIAVRIIKKKHPDFKITSICRDKDIPSVEELLDSHVVVVDEGSWAIYEHKKPPPFPELTRTGMWVGNLYHPFGVLARIRWGTLILLHSYPRKINKLPVSERTIVVGSSLSAIPQQTLDQLVLEHPCNICRGIPYGRCNSELNPLRFYTGEALESEVRLRELPPECLIRMDDTLGFSGPGFEYRCFEIPKHPLESAFSEGFEPNSSYEPCWLDSGDASNELSRLGYLSNEPMSRFGNLPLYWSNTLEEFRCGRQLDDDPNQHPATIKFEELIDGNREDFAEFLWSLPLVSEIIELASSFPIEDTQEFRNKIAGSAHIRAFQIIGGFSSEQLFQTYLNIRRACDNISSLDDIRTKALESVRPHSLKREKQEFVTRFVELLNSVDGLVSLLGKLTSGIRKLEKLLQDYEEHGSPCSVCGKLIRPPNIDLRFPFDDLAELWSCGHIIGKCCGRSASCSLCGCIHLLFSHTERWNSKDQAGYNSKILERARILSQCCPVISESSLELESLSDLQSIPGDLLLLHRIIKGNHPEERLNRVLFLTDRYSSEFSQFSQLPAESYDDPSSECCLFFEGKPRAVTQDGRVIGFSEMKIKKCGLRDLYLAFTGRYPEVFQSEELPPRTEEEKAAGYLGQDCWEPMIITHWPFTKHKTPATPTKPPSHFLVDVILATPEVSYERVESAMKRCYNQLTDQKIQVIHLQWSE